MSFKISITKEDLVFAAAHFITYAGHRCEKLHGHNYRVSVDAMVELAGQRAHDFLDGRKIDYVPAVLLERAFHYHAHAIVVAVELLAAVTGVRDEVRGREDQIFFGDGDLETH